MRIVDRPVVVDCMAVTRPLPALCAGGKIPRPLLGDVPRVGERSMGGARKPVQHVNLKKDVFQNFEDVVVTYFHDVQDTPSAQVTARGRR